MQLKAVRREAQVGFMAIKVTFKGVSLYRGRQEQGGDGKEAQGPREVGLGVEVGLAYNRKRPKDRPGTG